MKVNSNSLIKNWVFSTLRSNVIKNIFSLYIIHFANYLLPLIVVPYLVRVLSPSGFGIVSFAQSLIAYLTIFVDYGFALSATRKISVYRNNKIEVSRIFFNVLAAKGFLGLIGFIVLLLLQSSRQHCNNQRWYDCWLASPILEDCLPCINLQMP